MTSDINWGTLQLFNNVQSFVKEVLEDCLMIKDVVTTFYFTEKAGHEIYIQEDRNREGCGRNRIKCSFSKMSLIRRWAKSSIIPFFFSPNGFSMYTLTNKRFLILGENPHILELRKGGFGKSLISSSVFDYQMVKI